MYAQKLLGIALSSFNFLPEKREPTRKNKANRIHKRLFRSKGKNQFRACHEQSFLWRSLLLTCWGWLCRRMSVSSCFSNENKARRNCLVLKSPFTTENTKSSIREERARRGDKWDEKGNLWRWKCMEVYWPVDTLNYDSRDTKIDINFPSHPRRPPRNFSYIFMAK